MHSAIPLPSDTPESIARIAQIGHAVGAAVFVTGIGDRIEAANQKYRVIFPCCSFDDRPEFGAAFLQSVEAGINADSCLVADPFSYLRSIERFRLSERASFIKSWGNRRAFCLHYRCGDWTTRLTISIDDQYSALEKTLRDVSDVELFISMQAANATLIGALDESPQPTAFVFSDSRLSYWNRAMLKHLQTGAGLAISDDGRLIASGQDATLFASAVASRATAGGRPVVLALDAHHGHAAQLSTVSTAGPGLAMVQLPAPVIEDSALITLLCGLGFPPGRARIAVSIGAGMNVESVAAKHSITVSTVRTEIKNISKFIEVKKLSASKGIRSISDLVSKLASVAGSTSLIN
ncbi:helix-turn-helix transcriptional regulator [Azospirillum isscasi]|uniref:HTH luxR-type domain-containing protein n=1 Tax=Azospirillum isscasi TaxID=3053926 RepID=A0ABU0WD86_9PROT|nr:hypothetical protein [Azospirillum isscasi]MDQ2102153.1 hypothetical protein [Azospirillum isscasi]